MSTDTFSTHLQSLSDAIARFGHFRKRWSVLNGIASAIVIGPGALLLWAVLDWAFKLPAWPLFILFVVAFLYGCVAGVTRLAPPLLRKVRLEQEAGVIEALHGQLDNQIIGSLQLGREVLASRSTDKHLGYSPVFVAALLSQAEQKITALRPETLVDLSRAKRALWGALVIGGAIAASVVFAPELLQDRAQRLAVAYATVLDALFPVDMQVTPGNVAVVRGRPVSLSVDARGARRPEILLHRMDLKTQKTSVDTLALEQRQAVMAIANATESFQYSFEYAGRRTATYQVLVDDLPEISAINYELSPPAYTGQPARTLTGRLPRIGGLAGTTALVSFAATTELHPELCYVEWADGSKQTLSISGRFAHFSFTLDKPDRATLHISGVLGKGFEMEKPLSFELAVQRDEPPSIQVQLKNRQLTMLAEEAANFALDWTAEDDYGVSEIVLEYRIDTIDALLGRPNRDGSVPRRIEPARDRVKGRFAEMFKTLNPPLLPGDRITLTLTAKDNNTETGPGVGKSLPVEIVVVRPDLSGFTEQQFSFGAQSLLGGLKKLNRATDLLVDPDKTVRTEKAQSIDKQALKVRSGQESWPTSNGDAVADYFNLLSGGNR